MLLEGVETMHRVSGTVDGLGASVADQREQLADLADLDPHGSWTADRSSDGPE